MTLAECSIKFVLENKEHSAMQVVRLLGGTSRGLWARCGGAAGSSRSARANHQRHQDVAYASAFYALSPGLFYHAP